ncbi:sugar phosphate isomerase/epimerase family protein [Dethiosulfatarculus sandiegensis]|uniref:Xylose isomerase-like TIM barrel domain-containing protein n=1 Tax=Dethiosulfatarculus sandiegensis TaxID=1429043 RepID=A0A0D2JUA9_9BACT|nr:sugar phosphate isomerase/epimerase family protein [Dethiosulfatarculus sandiegensis]KIX13055.1 hypothetical protein X474_15940 [Dethiosulfatarculus sandiegensis]
MITLGCSTWFLRHMPISEALRIIKQNGFSLAEVWSDQIQLHGGSAREIGALARQLGLELTWHAASHDLNLTSRNSYLREAAFEQTKACLDLAKEAGASLLVLHPGRKSFTADEDDYYWALMRHIFSDLSKEAQKRGIPLALELMETKPCELVCSLEAFAKVAAWNLSNLFFTVDLAHLNTWGDPCRIWQSFDQKKLLHIHLSDNSLETMHLPLGRGNMNLDRLLRLIKKDFKKSIVLEGPSQGGLPRDLAAEFDFMKKRL